MSTHLAIRSCFSLLEGTLKIPEIVDLAVENGFLSIALCDHNVMYGSVSFYRECLKKNIKAIIGMEVDIMHEDNKSSVYLLAKDNNGYRNLLMCSTYLNTTIDYLTIEQLINYASGCILIIPSEKGIIETELLKDDNNKLLNTLRFFKDHHPNVYVGLASSINSLWKEKNDQLKELCKMLDIQTVAFSFVYYRLPNDNLTLKALKAIKDNKSFEDETIINENNRYFLSNDELMKVYAYDDLLNSDMIADQCNVDIYEKKSSLPVFSNKDHAKSKDYLYQLCKTGLKKRFEGRMIPKEYSERLRYELKVIFDMDYEDYFLIVWDFIKFARQRNIYVGPGRGSAAGSVVSWSLGITHVDPIHYGLLFERFLNPERISLPDIDVDFPDDHRDEVISYVASVYGKDHIAHISTFGTFKAKQAIRDIGRVLNLNSRELDQLAKSIPNALNIKLDQALVKSKRLQQLIESDERYRQVYHLAKKIEGLPRHISTHAAGIVMSSLNLTDVVPLIKIEPDMLSTQITMEYLEDLGLIKMDFLGLRNLTIIDKTLSYINEKIDILKIPLNDQKTYKMISSGNTVGLFQLESEGMKNLIVRMKPNQFTDIATCIALYRPGPMDNIPLYLKNRALPQSIIYLHDDLIPILSETYGVIIYQEQIMQIAQKMAGFALSKADILRKAMSKKNASELIKLRQDFIDGCTNKGYKKVVGEQLYELILKFANYGFNKSHSVAYALISYQMAYLKANYPQYFMLSLLDSVIGSESKTSEYINECKKCSVKIAPISINHSFANFVYEDDRIRMPLICIKGIGNNVVNEIIKERENDKFNDFYEFIARMNIRKISRSNIEALIKAGALDDFLLSRKTMLVAIDEALNYANLVKVDNPNQNYIDLGLVYKPQPILVEDQLQEKLDDEKEVLGFYLSEHPLSALKNKIGYDGKNISNLIISKDQVKILVNITRIKQYQAKTGEMAFVSASDESGSIDLVILPNRYRKFQDLLVKGKNIMVSGRMDKPQSLVVDNIELISN
ncbi:MAG: DNA polymerase III subunit alpha [Erysipelotrichaceae bacterium]|nr:DNA polymerase III subunit alpha [Erysipelotrichaceae bacterium]